MKNIIAAFIFFTRLPLWKMKIFYLDAKYFKNVINYWAVTAWLTASVMAGALWLSAQFLPFQIAIMMAIVVRLFLTGALHEDGLADFFDGIGGGHNKEQILRIMKDSHIGTYGTIALIIYYMILFNVIASFDLHNAIIFIIVADPFSKFIVSNMTLLLPYARTVDTSKSGTVYKKMNIGTFILSALFGLLPLVILVDIKFWVGLIAPVFLFFFLIYLLKKKIGAYTGDTCGALFLLCELMSLITFLVIDINF